VRVSRAEWHGPSSASLMRSIAVPTATRRFRSRPGVLIRSDVHVVWRGNAAPEDAGKVAAIATGHAA
jgi:hypothetical protein